MADMHIPPLSGRLSAFASALTGHALNIGRFLKTILARTSLRSVYATRDSAPDLDPPEAATSRRAYWRGMKMIQKPGRADLERQLAAVHTRINEMIREIDQRDELISDLQRRVQELEQDR
jgi:hypothetical protein